MPKPAPRTAVRPRAAAGATARAGERATARAGERAGERAPVPVLVLALVLALATLAVYAPVRSHAFLFYDDDTYVTENAVVSAGLTPHGVAWACTTFHATNWHPLTWLSHMLDVQLFGMAPGPQHLVNVLLHAAAAVLLFLAFRRATDAPWPSAFVAAVFALHPLHVESVAWIAERKDVLATLCGFAALLAYVRHAERPESRRLASVAAFLALSLLAKPTFVTAPFLFLLLDAWPLGRVAGGPSSPAGPRPTFPLARLALEKLPFLALAALSSIVTVIAQSSGGAVAGLHLGVGTRAANALVAYATYLGQAFWPANLAVLYPHRGTALPAWEWIVAAVLLVALTALALRVRARWPWVAVGWFWFGGTLVPMIGLVQVGVQSRADRYTYVPLTGIALAVAWSVAALVREGKIPRAAAAGAAVLALAAMAAATWHQLSFWTDHETLFRHALAVTEDNGHAESSLADWLYRAGRIDDGLVHARAAARLLPHNAKAAYNLGLLLHAKQDAAGARAAFVDATTCDPRHANAWMALGNVDLESDRFDDAERALKQAAALAPDSSLVYYNLGWLYGRTNRADLALAAFRECVRLEPNSADGVFRLGIALVVAGRAGEAQGLLPRLRALDPARAAELAKTLQTYR